jgi:hypothetical protein
MARAPSDKKSSMSLAFTNLAISSLDVHNMFGGVVVVPKLDFVRLRKGSTNEVCRACFKSMIWAQELLQGNNLDKDHDLHLVLIPW